MITHFHAVVLTFHDLFWQTGQGHATVKFAIAQITVSADKLCCALCGVDCFCDVWIEIFFIHLMHSLLYVITGILLKTNLHAFSFWGHFMFLLLVFHKVMELDRHLTFRFCCIMVSWIMLSLILVNWNWYFGRTDFCRLRLYPENIGNISPQTVGTHAGNHCLHWSAFFHTWGSLPNKLL
jgi:hypothetical protein